MIRLSAKDPDATVRYGWDVNHLLVGDATITNTTIAGTEGGIAVTGLVEATPGVVSGMVSGGEEGADATATLRFETSDGETNDLTIVIPIRHQ